MNRMIVFLTLFAVAALIFGNAERTSFGRFQKDSEALVIGKIIADRNAISIAGGANLGLASDGPLVRDSAQIAGSYELLKHAPSNLQVNPYLSQYGLQGKFYSFLYNSLGIANAESLSLVCAMLTAATLAAASIFYGQALGTLFGALFFASVAFSPWIVAFSRNLYWSPFLWFAPTLFSLAIYLMSDSRKKIACTLLLFLAVLAKCLAGYEYISTIIWLSCSIFLVDMFLPLPKLSRTKALAHAAGIFATGVLAFSVAILIHASIRGETILEGLNAIWQLDVKRRTYGDPVAFDPALHSSLSVSPLAVLATYIFSWKGPLLFLVAGKVFPVLLATAAAILAVKFWVSHPTRWRDLGLCVIFALGPISWYVLAKAHSHAHTHISYVLWYFGFVPAILFINTDGILLLMSRFAIGPSLQGLFHNGREKPTKI
jgi:hypothetical protein